MDPKTEPHAVGDGPMAEWPELTLSEWEGTRDAIDLWTQIVGKVRMALAPIVNHWWQVPFYASVRGLTTSLMNIGGLEAKIRCDARRDRSVEALCALSGVGTLTGMTPASEIGDISRFPTARKLCAWAGLTPSMRNSDRKAHHGHIAKDGPRRPRDKRGMVAPDP
jgi:hypothetical protein